MGLAFGAGFAASAYAATAAVHFLSYGRARRSGLPDKMLDRFMPKYDVIEKHSTRVDAPAGITFAAACEMDLLGSGLIRAIFRAREVMMGATPDRSLPRPFIKSMKAIGWGVLAHRPGREIVMGAVTKPWEANVVFHPLPPGRFANFDESGWVKIAWTLRADPGDPGRSIFSTETRVFAIEDRARSRFRRYWSLVAPGVSLIRMLSLRLVRSEARKRARAVSNPHS